MKQKKRKKPNIATSENIPSLHAMRKKTRHYVSPDADEDCLKLGFSKAPPIHARKRKKAPFLVSKSPNKMKKSLPKVSKYKVTSRYNRPKEYLPKSRPKPRSRFDFYQDLRGKSSFYDDENNPFSVQERMEDQQPFSKSVLDVLIDFFPDNDQRLSMMLVCKIWCLWISEAVIARRMALMKDFISKTDIEFIRIPAGVYMIGSTPSSKKFWNTPSHFYKSNEFYISKKLIHVSDWEKICTQYLQKSKSPEHEYLQSLVTEEDIESIFFNTIVLSNRHVHVQKDYIENDPPLLLTFKKCARIAYGLGATLPTWQQWEVASRGEKSLLFPWGNRPMKMSELGAQKIPYSYITEDLYGLDNRRIVKKGHVKRVQSLDSYHDIPSSMGMEDLVFFGKEFNLAQNDLEAKRFSMSSSEQNFKKINIKTHCLRSLVYLGPQTTFIPSHDVTDADPLDTVNFERMGVSEHRSFNGPSLSSCIPSSDRFSMIENCAFRLVFSKSTFQVHPLLSAGRFTCQRCGYKQEEYPLCLDCVFGDGQPQSLWMTLLGKHWKMVDQLVGIPADIEKHLPDWTHHCFHKLYYEGVLVSSTSTKMTSDRVQTDQEDEWGRLEDQVLDGSNTTLDRSNTTLDRSNTTLDKSNKSNTDKRSVDRPLNNVMKVAEVSFLGPHYIVESDKESFDGGYAFEYGYCRPVVPQVQFGDSYHEISKIYGEGYELIDNIVEWSGEFAILSDKVVVLYFGPNGLERISVRLTSFILPTPLDDKESVFSQEENRFRARASVSHVRIGRR